MDIESVRSRVGGTVQAPSSKSYAQRAIAAALLAAGTTTLHNVELCGDTEAALAAAVSLGARWERRGTDYVITGGWDGRGLSPLSTKIDVGESGLSARMFAPIAALCGCCMTITGGGSLVGRPFGALEEPLRGLGAQADTAGGTLPVTVCGPLRGGMVEVDGSLSSQFVTGLLMALPLAQEDTTIHVSDPVSTPYLDMTLDLLGDFGVEVSHNHDYTEFFIRGGQSYLARSYDVEGDWSGASCLLVAGAVAGEVTVENLNPLSLQADVALVHALSLAGAEVVTDVASVTVRRRELNAFRFDATHSPDLFPALVALAACCEGQSVIKGTRRLVAKESDRAKALEEVFGQMGIEIDMSEDDLMKVTGGQVRSAVIDSHGDHRIAMSVAVAGLRSDGAVTIRNAEVVAKSYPDFWDDLQTLRDRV